MYLPNKKITNYLEQQSGSDLLIYNLSTNQALCLNKTAAEVFAACDGRKTLADLNLPEDIIYLSLDELKKQNLIEDNYASPFAGMNRREVVRRVGLSTMFALPVISSLIAPASANAASSCVGNGTIAPGSPVRVCVGGSTAAERDLRCNINAPGKCCSGKANASTQSGSCPFDPSNSAAYNCTCIA